MPSTTSRKPRARRKPSTARLRKQMHTALKRLQTAELVSSPLPDEQEYSFKHNLVQDTAYASLLKQDRKRLNRNVAQTLERLYPDHLDDLAAPLAEHYSRAGDDPKTLKYATRAGDVSARVYANQEALEHYAKALHAAKRSAASTDLLIHLFTRRGRILEVIGSYQQALDSYDDMAALARQRGDRRLELAALMLRALTFAAPTRMFNPERARSLADAALALARELDDRGAQARILWTLSLLNQHLVDSVQAQAYGEQSLAIVTEMQAEGLDVREQLAYTLHDLYIPYHGTGQPERAREVGLRARALWRELDNKPMLVDNLGMTAQFSMFGDLDHSLEWASEGAQIAGLIGNGFGFALNSSILAWVYFFRGEIERALPLAAEAIAAVREIHAGGLVTFASELTFLYGSIGAFDRAHEMEQVTRSNLSRPMPPHFRVRAHTALARLAILRGDLSAAEAELAADREEEPELGARPDPLGRVAKLELLHARREFDRILESAVPLVEAYRARGLTVLAFLVLCLQARALQGLGRSPEALEAWRAAEVEGRRMNARTYLWQILAALGDLERERGNFAESESLRTEARAVVQYIRDHMPPEYRASFLDLPAVRAVTT